MANILSLALRVTADASGLRLDPVQKALVALGNEADKLTSVFDKFAGQSAAAGAAQQKFSEQLAQLQNRLRDGLGATQFAIEFEKLKKAIDDEANALGRAARITEANITPLERYEQTIAELDDQVKAGRISQETYERALAKAKTQLDGTSASASNADKSLASMSKSVKALSAIEIGRAIIDGLQSIASVVSSVIKSIASFVSSVANSLDQFNDLSARTGIGVEALQGYSLAAKLAGVDTEAFGAAVQKLGVNIGKATPGDALDKSLRNINLSVAQLRSLSPEQQFSAISEAISGLPTAADRAAAAVEIFGKQGAALAPLFREGADGIEELRDRAERLGIIVDETQISNIGEMNDAFDLVSATVQGIAGQVIGNLAPAVTGVVEQFLKFIEEWSGAEGSGGSGIANAITDVLLTGAETLAAVFDKFVGDFSGFTSILQGVGTTFSVVANVLVAASETLRVIFNVFESIGNSIALALGKVLQGIGSWFSSDLEAFGKSLQDEAKRSLAQNNKDLESAATNAANAVQNAFTGNSASPIAAGEGAATQFIQGVRQRFDTEQAPEFKINTNIEKTRERFDSFFNGIVDNSSIVTESMREFEAAVAAAQEDGSMTADEIDRIAELQAKVNAAIDQELTKRQDAAEAAAKQSEEVDKIVKATLAQIEADTLYGGDTGRAKAAENLLLVQSEIVRVEEQLRAAREAGDQSAIDAATSRLAALDQVAAKEESIASGADKQRKEAIKEAERIDKEIAKNQEKIADAQLKQALERAEQLAKVQSGSVKLNDIRDGGISAFFDALKEDPALKEAKKQSQELAQIRKEIVKLNSERVDILSGTG